MLPDFSFFTPIFSLLCVTDSLQRDKSPPPSSYFRLHFATGLSLVEAQLRDRDRRDSICENVVLITPFQLRGAKVRGGVSRVFYSKLHFI